MSGSTLRLAGNRIDRGDARLSRRRADVSLPVHDAPVGGMYEDPYVSGGRTGGADASRTPRAGMRSRAVTDTRGVPTPSSLMVPRVLFASLAVGLVLFGLLMIYSSSSITAMVSDKTGHDPTYYFLRQAIFAGVGLLFAIGLAALDYHCLRGKVIVVAWAVTIVGLLAVYVPSVSQEAFGASRWIALGPFMLQPSEFAKATIILVGVLIMERYYGEGSLDTLEALKWVAGGVLVPLGLILMQPDKGTCGVILLTLLIMMYLSGVPGKTIAIAGGCVLVVALAYAFKDEYSRARIMTVIDPESDPYGDGYQLMQGFYALGYGGLFGTGLGLSRQKYNYLPMAHNDFIFTIVGEEFGFVGAVALMTAFIALLWAGYKIAQHANDLAGRLTAAGCTSLLAVQLLLNVSGVLALFPMSGKPVPFISYGGSSVVSCLILVGLTLSVSLHSGLPETGYEQRRAEMRVVAEVEEESDVGEPQARSTRRQLRVIEGGSAVSRSQGSRPVGRLSTDAHGRRRLDLGPTPAERLRGRR